VTRIPKGVKHDIEAISLLRIKQVPSLLLLGSGSLEPYRSKGWLLNIQNKQKKLLDLEPFYKRLLANGIKEKNIEGATAIGGGIVLANRGNKSFPKNYLVFTTNDFWDHQTTADIRVMKLGANTDTASFSGVSGLEYSSKSDCLLLTISTENTYSTNADGTVGKSYLWLIYNVSAKKRMAAINPDRIVDLEAVDSRFKGHKIESVCIVSENKSEYRLILVADDDKGTTILFKVRLQKKR
jgi:WD40 repeat protein